MLITFDPVTFKPCIVLKFGLAYSMLFFFTFLNIIFEP